MMNMPIQLDPNDETKPIIRDGDYEFQENTIGYVTITNKDNESKVYSFDALRKIAGSKGMPLAMREMAKAALKSVGQS